ncbi:MAG: peptidylprolyl isomerase [Melioribacteraceae bacterium]|nr:peptidylprolyl isomerase [Melioribacteraceae bacterium]MCF8263028.1 peptidylprolyl isomerase [Melioribacteraceae bacterium]MCF8430473.1 peptidylprolyl isomerase [Melioribacteraceae bacterium]
MSIVQSGNTVKVHYTGKLVDGSVFDSSEGKDPLEFTIGSGSIITGFEEATLGMQPGDKKSVEIKAEEAYGAEKPELIYELDIANVPPEITPEVGLQLQSKLPNGQPVQFTITAVTDDKVTLDANHPLAGKDLVFDIELVEIIEDK